MTIEEAIRNIDKIKPNHYSEEEKINWLSMLDGLVHREIILTHIGMTPGTKDFAGYRPEDDMSTELMVPYPYDEVYRWFLEMKIDEANGESVKANNATVKYNTLYEAYMDRYNKTHMPLSVSNRFFF